MRTFQIRFIAFAVVAVMLIPAVHVAQAALIVYDSFSGASGTNLAGTTPTTPNPNTSGANQQWYNDPNYTGNTFAAPGLSFPNTYHNAPPVSGNAVSINTTDASSIVINNSGAAFTYGAAIDVPTAYYSFLLNVPSNTGTAPLAAAGSITNSSSNASLIAAFSDGNGPSGNLGTQVSGLYITAGTSPNTFDLGIGANRAGIGFSAATSNLTAGQTYLVVGSFVQGSPDTSSLWINPVLGHSSAPAALATQTGGESGGANDNEVNRFTFAYMSGSPTGGLLVDELRIGTTWADVTPAGLSVPEPSSLVLAGLGAVGLIWSIRRRRKA